MKTLIFTCGDVNGIGPEIAVKTINEIYNSAKRKIVFIVPQNIFEATCSIVKPLFNYKVIKDKTGFDDNSNPVFIYNLGKVKQKIGKPSKESGRISALAIEKAFELASQDSQAAIITSPTSKTSFELAGINYPGQTEFFADLSKSKKYMMMFLSSKMICALATIHEPISKIPKLLTKQRIKTSLEILKQTLIEDLGIANPKIAVLGLNPHSGEKGRIGREEIDTIIPAIKMLKDKNIYGAFVPDAFFGSGNYKNFDAILGMYHDQVLIPFKMLNFSSGVNYTAALPIIRVSPDHGTAYEIAGKGIANYSSMLSSVKWALKIIENRNRNYER